jgi:hypothetical protein
MFHVKLSASPSGWIWGTTSLSRIPAQVNACQPSWALAVPEKQLAANLLTARYCQMNNFHAHAGSSKK